MHIITFLYIFYICFYNVKTSLIATYVTNNMKYLLSFHLIDNIWGNLET